MTDESGSGAERLRELESLRGTVRALEAAERARREAESELRRTNEILERIFSTTEFLIAYLDEDFAFIRVNRAYADKEGVAPDWFVGKNHFALYPNAENEAIFRRVVETGEPFEVYARPFEYPEHPEYGVTYWNWTVQPVKEAGGAVSGLILSLADVTERERLVMELRGSLASIKTLSGLLPICASCKKIRDDQGYWNQVEHYISEHTAAQFSHGLCPECLQRLYPE